MLVQLCDGLVDNLYLALIARLSEPDSKVIMSEKSGNDDNAPITLSRAQSVVNMNSAESLLGQAF